MNVIVAVDKNWAIGRDGDQLAYISDDLKHLKALTVGHTVILGRKTLATFPDGKPLKGRRNLILTNNRNFSIDGAEIFYDLDTLLSVAPKDSFVIGGASVYKSLLNQCDTAYVTKIDYVFHRADCWFPNLDYSRDWKPAYSGPIMSDGRYEYRFVEYEKNRGKVC